jgi:glyoxylase-like metal-dependent hydrolase (beta-lactamase superfamily II)
VFDGPDGWRLRDWCFVVRAGDRVVLVDTGVGGAGTPGADWIGTPGRLPEELAAAGVAPDEVEGPGSDALPEAARRSRRRLLDQVEAEAIWLAPAHFPEPFGTVTRSGDGRHWSGRR